MLWLPGGINIDTSLQTSGKIVQHPHTSTRSLVAPPGVRWQVSSCNTDSSKRMLAAGSGWGCSHHAALLVRSVRKHPWNRCTCHGADRQLFSQLCKLHYNRQGRKAEDFRSRGNTRTQRARNTGTNNRPTAPNASNIETNDHFYVTPHKRLQPLATPDSRPCQEVGTTTIHRPYNLTNVLCCRQLRSAAAIEAAYIAAINEIKGGDLGSKPGIICFTFGRQGKYLPSSVAAGFAKLLETIHEAGVVSDGAMATDKGGKHHWFHCQ